MPEPLFTAQQVKDDGVSRVAKTGGQVGIGTALVTLGQALCQSRGWLHGELSPIVFGAYVAVVTTGGAGLTNLSRLRGHQ